MRRLAGFALSLVPFFAVPPASAQPRPDTRASIKFDEQQAVEFVGDVKAAGTVSVDKDAGLTVVSIKLVCVPIAGGKLSFGEGEWRDGKWKSKISGLAPGIYSMKAEMTAKDGNGNEKMWGSSFLKIYLSAPPVPPKKKGN